MPDTEALLRELIEEVRALRETVARAHARHLVHDRMLAGATQPSGQVREALDALYREAMTAGRRAVPQAEPAVGICP